MVVSVTLDNRVVCDVGKPGRDEAAESVIVCVEVRAEEFGDEIWFLVRRGAEILPRAVNGGNFVLEIASLLIAGTAVGRRGALFIGQQVFLLGFEGLW